MQPKVARHWKSGLAITHDTVMAGLALLLALWMRLGTVDHPAFDKALTTGLPLFVAIAACCFLISGMYRGIWSYASMNDLAAITKATTAAILIFTLSMFLFNRLEDFPRSTPIITWFVLMALLGGPRFLYRLTRDRRLLTVLKGVSEASTPVLLVGAGDGAELFVRAVRNDAGSTYHVVGAIDDKGSRVGRTIHGIPVLGTLKDLDAVLRRLERGGRRPARIVLTKTSDRLDGALVGQILNCADAHGIAVFRLPQITSLTDSVQANALDLRPIAIEDLLGRPQTNLDRTPIRELIAGARIAVTGAGGTIGREITRQIAALGPARLLLLDNSEFNLYDLELEIGTRFADGDARLALADVRDRDAMVRLMTEERPDFVFHAAALKHLPIVERNPHEGVLTNVCGTRNVADAALATGARAMVLISTDKAVRPTSVMGATKRLAEAYCQGLDLEQAAKGDTGAAATRFVTVRFGNVLGSTGSVIPLFQKQLAAGGPLTVTHPDVERFFMTVREAVELVLRATALGIARDDARGEVYVLDMGRPVKIVDLARQMITLSGLRPDVDVAVRYTGLRPGEKLSEELFESDERRRSATGVTGIHVASPTPVEPGLLRRAIDQLDVAARAAQSATIYRVIATVVPAFRRRPDDDAGAPRPDAANRAVDAGGRDGIQSDQAILAGP